MCITINSLSEGVTDRATQSPLELPRDPRDLYRLFKRSDVRMAVAEALAKEPYLRWKISSTLDALATPAAYRLILKQHEKRVRWQIQRVWRARCDIVHSARRAVSEFLLCANLEFYLKVTLMSLLAQLRQIKTLSDPEEFFERRIYSYQKLVADLESGSDAVLEDTLSEV
jgi:hypothetical protein